MAEEKTQPATPRRLQKAREDGRVAVSRELSSLVSLSAGLLALAALTGPADVAHWLGASLLRTRYDGAHCWELFGETLLLAVAPAAAAASAGAFLSGSVQTEFLINPTALQPKLDRISPLAGIKRLFSAQSLVQALKSVTKLGVLGACLYAAGRHVLPVLPVLPFLPPDAVLGAIHGSAARLVLWLLGAQSVIALADVLWERAHLARQLRMSLQEVKDEHKETEGNPQIRQRLRQLARLRARRRMLKAVPKAAVVVTNPTHYAVALAYERGAQGAPRLVAKGADEVAARIRDLARAHNVPIVANPPLARALFRIDIDMEIPVEHFRAVAEIIAYVWRMRDRVGRQ